MNQERVSSSIIFSGQKGDYHQGSCEAWFGEAEREVTHFFVMWKDFLVPQTTEATAFENTFEEFHSGARFLLTQRKICGLSVCSEHMGKTGVLMG